MLLCFIAVFCSVLAVRGTMRVLKLTSLLELLCNEYSADPYFITTALRHNGNKALLICCSPLGHMSNIIK